MNKLDHQRKQEKSDTSTNLSPVLENKKAYSSSDWTGTLRLFSLYPLLFILYVIPVIFNLNGFDFPKIVNSVVIYFVTGSLLAKALTACFPIKKPKPLSKGLMISQALIILSFLIYSFSVYIHPYSSLQSFLWFILGLASTYHDYLEHNFITKVLNYKPKWVSTFLESPEIMMQAFAYFLLLFFLTVFFPFLMSAMLSFFFYARDNFNTFLPLTFGNLILIFVFIYHTVCMSLDPQIKQKIEENSTEQEKENLSIFSPCKKEIKARLLEIKGTIVQPYFIFQLGSLPPLFGLPFFFLYCQPNTSPVNILLNLAIVSSLSLVLKTFLFFHLPPYLKRVNLRRLAEISMGFFIFLLFFYIYAMIEINLSFYLTVFIFLGLRFISDIVWINSLYLKKNSGGHLEVDASMLSFAFSILPSPALLAAGAFSLLYPFLKEYGTHFISIFLILFSLSLSGRTKE